MPEIAVLDRESNFCLQDRHLRGSSPYNLQNAPGTQLSPHRHQILSTLRKYIVLLVTLTAGFRRLGVK